MCPLAPRPPGAGRVGRAYGASRSALTARGLCGQSPRPVLAGCHMSRGTPAPGSPGRPLQACGVRAAATGRRGHPQLQASGLTLPPKLALRLRSSLVPAPPERSALSRSPTCLRRSGFGRQAWPRPPRPDPAKCPEPGTCGPLTWKTTRHVDLYDLQTSRPLS